MIDKRKVIKPKKRNSLTILICKSEDRLKQLKKNNAPEEDIKDEQEWLHKLLDKEKACIKF
ncbi:hypothetical protein [Bacillus phage vB_BanS-Thrax2]|nr:hypothetical protein [Bacillus phage vB_BanS-Thrax2]